MTETISIGLETYLLGLIAFLLVILLFMLGKVIGLLTAFQDRPNQMAFPETAGFDRPVTTTDCTEEELAAITAVLTKLLPNQQLNIVNLKLIR